MSNNLISEVENETSQIEAKKFLKSAVTKLMKSIIGVNDFHLALEQDAANQFRFCLYLTYNPGSLSSLLLRAIKEQLELQYPLDFCLVNFLPRNANGLVDTTKLKNIPRIGEPSENIFFQKAKKILDDSLIVDSIRLNTDINIVQHWHFPTVIRQDNSRLSLSFSVESYLPSDQFDNQEKDHTPMALMVGEPIENTKFGISTMPEALENTALNYPNKGLVFITAKGEKTFTSYPSLLKNARCIATGLTNAGVEAGSPMIILSSDIQQLISAFWGGYGPGCALSL